ncbi:MAG TPA: GyrI-like domain-containing protein [Chthonomonadales bacterium]|nr:GyrI-like domain-containing protein [Chthonomonadales bacterium]
MDVQIRTEPERQVAALRHTGPYHEIGSAFGKLAGWAASQGIPQGESLALYHDDPGTTPASELRSDACMVLPASVNVSGDGVREMTLPAGRYAVTTHTGHYSTLGDGWAAFLQQWLPSSGQQPDFTKPCMEIYVDDCSVTPAEKLRTELCIPLQGAA